MIVPIPREINIQEHLMVVTDRQNKNIKLSGLDTL